MASGPNGVGFREGLAGNVPGSSGPQDPRRTTVPGSNIAGAMRASGAAFFPIMPAVRARQVIAFTPRGGRIGARCWG